MPEALSQSNLIHYLCQEWGYPGVSAVLREDASVLLPIINVYEWGQDKSGGSPIVNPQTVVDSTQAIEWDPPEIISQADLLAMEAQDGAQRRT